jgi:hypothetical protein
MDELSQVRDSIFLFDFMSTTFETCNYGSEAEVFSDIQKIFDDFAIQQHQVSSMNSY